MNNNLNLVYDDWPFNQEFPNANRPISPAMWHPYKLEIKKRKNKYNIIERPEYNQIIIQLLYDIKSHNDTMIDITEFLNKLKKINKDKFVFIELVKTINSNDTDDIDVMHFCEFCKSYETMDVFHNVQIVNYRINDIKEYPNENFFYQLWPRSDLYSPFLQYGILPINTNVIDVFKNNKNLNLIFMNHVEACNEMTFAKLNEILLYNDMDTSRVWVVTNNPKIKNYKKKLNSNINVYSTNAFPNFFEAIEMIPFKPEKDGLFFLCHNRMPRIHRYVTLSLLKKYNILDDVDWSLINGWEKDELQRMSEYSLILNDSDFVFLKNEIDYFEKIDTFKSRYELNHTEFDDKSNPIDFDESKTFENSYFNIVTETNFLDDLIHVTEKSLRPFWFLQFPIIIASHGHIDYMKKLYNFDFFDDIIDHSYDKIENNRDRIFAALTEIKKIHENKEFFIDFYKKNENRFILNRNRIIEYQNNKDDFKFFKKLNNKIC